MLGPRMDSSEREVALVGAGIAAVSAIALVGSLWFAWYRYPAFCYYECGQTTRGGWSALGGGSALLVAGAVAGALPAGAVAWGRRALRECCTIGAIAGLAAALLVAFRLAAVPGALPGESYARLPGGFIALLGGGRDRRRWRAGRTRAAILRARASRSRPAQRDPRRRRARHRLAVPALGAPAAGGLLR